MARRNYRAIIRRDVTKALENLSGGPYVHSATFKEFNYLSDILKSLGFRKTGNVRIRSDPLNRKVWQNADYDVIRTLGFSVDGVPLQDFNNIPANDYIFFFIRPRIENQKVA